MFYQFITQRFIVNYLPAVNFLRLGLKYSGHMSTIPVTKLSTMQNSLSIPIV